MIRVFAQPGRHDEVFLHDRRFASDGTAIPEFVLNQPTYAGAQILVAQRNFGVGSSREAAVMALTAAGFRCVVAESFGDIFVNNCFKNGVLPVQLPAEEVDAVRASAATRTRAPKSRSTCRASRSSIRTAAATASRSARCESAACLRGRTTFR